MGKKRTKTAFDNAQWTKLDIPHDGVTDFGGLLSFEVLEHGAFDVVREEEVEMKREVAKQMEEDEPELLLSKKVRKKQRDAAAAKEQAGENAAEEGASATKGQKPAKPTKKRKEVTTEEQPKKKAKPDKAKSAVEIPQGGPSLREAIATVVSEAEGGAALTNKELQQELMSRWSTFGDLTAEKVKKASKGLKTKDGAKEEAEAGPKLSRKEKARLKQEALLEGTNVGAAEEEDEVQAAPLTKKQKAEAAKAQKAAEGVARWKAAEAEAKKKKAVDAKAKHGSVEKEEAAAATVARPKYLTVPAAIAESEDYNTPASMAEWSRIGLHPAIMRGIAELGFARPTPIQVASIPPAIKTRKDVVGAAATGSGKTLAFGLPVIHRILELYEQIGPTSVEAGKLGLLALIVSPTRELSLQIADHLKAATRYTGIQIAQVVGGLSQLKQERLLSRRPEIVVGTPGRLWEMIESGVTAHLSVLNDLSFLVLDEADRLIDQGHFTEVSNIINFIATRKGRSEAVAMMAQEGMSVSAAANNEGKIRVVQKFLFSATMTLQMTGKKLQAHKVSGVENDMLEKLLKQMDFRGDPRFVDLSNKGQATATHLTEFGVKCSKDEKELYLYSILANSPGRTLVFTNAISYVRRLASIFKNLDLPVYALHADLQQKQRLKAMDRFRADNDAVMIATDVAARGLDVDNVDVVIHFHLPRTADLYIHRSGRTARAEKDGTSIAMISAEEMTLYTKLSLSLGRGKDGLPDWNTDPAYLSDLLNRLRLAREIDDIENKSNKKSADKSWMKKNAEAIGFDLDSDDDDGEGQEAWDDSKKNTKLKTLREELKFALQEPLRKSRKMPVISAKTKKSSRAYNGTK